MKTTELIESFGPAFVIVGILFVFYILPIYWLIGFAKRERKDWRIALAAGLIFTWIFAWLILLIVPKLSDEEHERINRPGHERRSFSTKRGPREPWELPTMDDVFQPAMWFLGICSVFALVVMAWMQWGM